jgi:putative addiction module killer protein
MYAAYILVAYKRLFMQVEHYLASDGKDIFERRLDQVRDRRAVIAIERRIARIERDGYFGDHKFLRQGVSEIRIDEGAGYRVYYSQIETVVVLLLRGGNKSTQDADINRAIANLKEFQRRRKAGRA